MIIVASNNAHKIQELGEILANWRIITAGSILSGFDPEETGSSFLENSLIKARELHARLQQPEQIQKCRRLYGAMPMIIADDSGLAVDALGGKPGIYSARFGREEGARSSAEQNALLLSMLEDVPAGAKRSARYICCMTLLLDEQRIFTVQESWEGEIALRPSEGSGGFGYDPIFFLPDRDCTAADISAEEKNRLSHRGRATRGISALLDYLSVS